MFFEMQAQIGPENFVIHEDKFDFSIQAGYARFPITEWYSFNKKWKNSITNESFSIGVGLKYFLNDNWGLTARTVFSEREFWNNNFLNHSILGNYNFGGKKQFYLQTGLSYSHEANFEKSNENTMGINLGFGYQLEVVGQKLFFEFENITYFRNVSSSFNDPDNPLFGKSLSVSIGFVF